MQEEAAKKVETLFPGYNAYAKKRIADDAVKEQLKDKKAFNDRVHARYNELKDAFQDEKGRTYLLEHDSYQWLLRTEYVLQRGYPGTGRDGNDIYDSYTLAPVGKKLGHAQFLFYASAFLYRAFNVFFKNTSLESFLFYLPIFYAMIFLIVVYLFAARFFSNAAAFFATLFIGLNGMVLNKSCAGWFDYDTLSLTIPILICWCLLSALKEKRNIAKLLAYSIAASFFQGLYVFTWVGWWFIFLIIGIFFALSILNSYSVYYDDRRAANRENRYYIISGLTFLAGSIVFCFLIAKVNLIYDLFALAKSNLYLGQPLTARIWPNTYYTVSELATGDAGRIVDILYGKEFFIAAVLGIFIETLRRKEERKDILAIMVFWFALTWVASFKAVKLTTYLSIPLGLFFGNFISEICPKAIERLSFNLKSKIFLYGVYSFLIILVLKFFFVSGSETMSHLYPCATDRWMKALTYVKENTAENTIVNAWWDFGSLFKAETRRRVIFDGQSQDTPVAYWMAKALIAKDEKEAVKILRMLNNASYTTFDLLNEYIPDQFECAVILEKLLENNVEKGKVILREKAVPDDMIDKILDDLNRKPPPACFIVESSMIAKMGVISFLGNWDFIKLFIYKNRNKPKNEVINHLCGIFGLTQDRAAKYYNEVLVTPAGKTLYESLSRRYFFSEYSSQAGRDGNLLYFDNGLVYDEQAGRSLAYSAKGRKFTIPAKILAFDGDIEKEIKLENGGYKTALISKYDDNYESLFLDEGLIDSLYTRLFFLGGKGLQFFKPFYMDKDAGICIYEIKWE